jgi:hypothetical protein
MVSKAGSGTMVAWKLSAIISVKSKLPSDVWNVPGAIDRVPVVEDSAVLRP